MVKRVICIGSVLVLMYASYRFGQRHDPLEKEQLSVTTSHQSGADRETERTRIKSKRSSPPKLKAQADFKSSFLPIGSIKNAAQAQDLRSRLIQWASENPLMALEYAENNTRILGDGIIESILIEWAKVDSSAAWELTYDKYSSHVNSVLNQISKMEADKAWGMAAVIAEQDPSAGYEAYASVIQGVVFGGDCQKAIDLIDSTEIEKTLQSADGGYSLYSYVLDEWTRYEPLDAAKWVASISNNDLNAKTAAEKALVETWTHKAPEEALNYFFGNLEKGEFRDGAINQALAEWASRDLVEASDWILENGNSPEFDPAAFNIAIRSEIVSVDPHLAMNWVNSITDPKLQQDGLSLVLQQWLQIDEQAAQQQISLMGDSLHQASFDQIMENHKARTHRDERN